MRIQERATPGRSSRTALSLGLGVLCCACVHPPLGGQVEANDGPARRGATVRFSLQEETHLRAVSQHLKYWDIGLVSALNICRAMTVAEQVPPPEECALAGRSSELLRGEVSVAVLTGPGTLGTAVGGTPIHEMLITGRAGPEADLAPPDGHGKAYRRSSHSARTGELPDPGPRSPERIDLRFLLPSSPVPLGDPWEIDPKLVGRLFRSFGDATFQYSLDSPPRRGGAWIAASGFLYSPAEWDEKVYGKAAVRLLDRKSENGDDLAVMEIVLDVWSSRDSLQRVTELAESLGISEDLPVAMAAFVVRSHFKARGTLVWDLETGCPHDLELNGDLRAWGSLTGGGASAGSRLEVRLQGTSRIAVRRDEDS